MGRRKMTWEELRNRGCKPGRWKARQAEQDATNPKKWVVDRYRAAKQKEAATFASRCIPGETLCRNLDGSVFAWPSNHFLSEAREVAREIVSDPDYKYPETKKQCADFLSNLESGATQGLFLDSIAADNAELMIVAFAKPDFELFSLHILDLCEYFGWKDISGNRVLNDSTFLATEVQAMVAQA
jgi:hypothetical protein